MKLIGKEGCPDCIIFKKQHPSLEYIEIPDLDLGFGDTICRITCFFGITPCASCRLRQSFLNKLIPYSWNIKKVKHGILELKNSLLKQGIKKYPVVLDDNGKIMSDWDIKNPYKRW